MKKRVLMSLVVLAIVGTSAAVFPPRVFAQQPTLDKLEFAVINGGKAYRATYANKSVSGAVVIPSTYNGIPVTQIGGNWGDNTLITSLIIPEGVTETGPNANVFWNCKELTSVTLPASLKGISFQGCTKLTSVTIGGSNLNGTFPGDLAVAYKANGAGTYTRPAGGNNWTKQGGGFTLNGTWTRSDGMQITITENGQNITITGNLPNNGGRLNKAYTER